MKRAEGLKRFLRKCWLLGEAQEINIAWDFVRVSFVLRFLAAVQRETGEERLFVLASFFSFWGVFFVLNIYLYGNS